MKILTILITFIFFFYWGCVSIWFLDLIPDFKYKPLIWIAPFIIYYLTIKTGIWIADSVPKDTPQMGKKSAIVWIVALVVSLMLSLVQPMEGYLRLFHVVFIERDFYITLKVIRKLAVSNPDDYRFWADMPVEYLIKFGKINRPQGGL